VLTRLPLEAGFTWVRRTLLVVFGIPMLLGAIMTAVDSYRRRGKKPKPFPVSAPETVPIGQGEITTYTYGRDLYADMLAAIEGAQRQVLFETYIWKGDAVGEEFKRALTEAAARGVSVYCIYDTFANLVVSPSFKRFPATMKVLRYPIYSAGWKFFDLRRYGRDHRKILVVDDDVAFVGGYNIGAPYETEWRDTHVRITGPAVADLRRAFSDMWNMHRRRRVLPSERPLLQETAATWDPQIRFQRNIPRLWMFPIRSMYIEAINRSTQRVWITQAYFLPDSDFMDALLAAADRGVDVRVMMPMKANHVVADWVSRGYFTQMLDAGVRILRFQGAMVHAKTMTVDGVWTTVGTANIDRLSLQGNYEINVEVIDDDLAATMEAIFATDSSNCLELTQSEWESRDIHRRFTEWVLRPLRPML
jgi:cardiolipin synthase